jgi:hypothetical protein
VKYQARWCKSSIIRRQQLDVDVVGGSTSHVWDRCWAARLKWFEQANVEGQSWLVKCAAAAPNGYVGSLIIVDGK